MCGNIFKLHEKVDGDTAVERTTTKIMGLTKPIEFKWNEEHGYEYLTLDEILNQVIESNKNVPIFKNRTPFLRVWYETGMWGVIFEVGNYKDMGDQWIVHGITKGYA